MSKSDLIFALCFAIVFLGLPFFFSIVGHIAGF